MKKLLNSLTLMVCCSLVLVSCKDSDPDPDPIADNLTEMLVGDWVYDNQETKIWEVMHFTKSGVFYYSNQNFRWEYLEAHNEDNSGLYWIDGRKVLGSYKIGQETENMEFEVTAISKYSFTAIFTNVGLPYTYSRQIDNIQLKKGEKGTSKIVNSMMAGTTGDNVRVLGFSTHNAKIATVDATTGEVTGVTYGTTYIDVVTDQGTAVVEVTVVDMEELFEDYSWTIGKTIPEVINVLGNNYSYRDDDNILQYLSNQYALDTLTFETNQEGGKTIEYTRLHVRDKITPEQVMQNLNKKYEFYMSLEENEWFDTGIKADGKPVFAAYNKATNKIWYTTLDNDTKFLLPDLKIVFGQNASYVSRMAKELSLEFLFTDYSYSKDGSDYYNVNDDVNIYMIGFVYNKYKKVCEYWLYFTQGTKYSDVTEALSSENYLNYQLTNSTQDVYNDPTFRYTYFLLKQEGCLRVVDTQQTNFDPPTKSKMPDLTKGLRKTHQQILNEFGNVPYENTEENIAYLSEYSLFSMYMFMFDTATKLVKAAGAYISSNVTSKDVVSEYNAMYTPFAKGTKEDGSEYAWINASTLESATAGIIYYVNNNVVMYVPLNGSNNAKSNQLRQKQNVVAMKNVANKRRLR